MKNILKFLLAVVVIAVGGGAVKAQTVPHDLSEWPILNKDLATFQINDGATAVVDGKTMGTTIRGIPLYEIFNETFGTLYTSSNELVADYKEKDQGTGEWIRTADAWEALQGAGFYTIYQNSEFNLNLNLDFGNGIKVGGDGVLYPDSDFFFRATTTDTPINNVGLDPVAVGRLGEFTVSLDIYTGSGSLEGTNYPTNAVWKDFFSPTGVKNDGLIHMIAFNVTDLMQLYDDSVTEAWLFAWEERFATTNDVDFSYQDLVQIFYNVKPSSDKDNVVPEPATVLILLSGMAAYPLARRFRRK